MVYLAKGKLPWQGLLFFDEETRIRRIAEIKCSIQHEKLTEGLPDLFISYFKHVKELKFTDKPDYDYLRSLFKNEAASKNYNLEEHCFEWQSKANNSVSPMNKQRVQIKSTNNLDDKKKAGKFGAHIPHKISSNLEIKQSTVTNLGVPN